MEALEQLMATLALDNLVLLESLYNVLANQTDSKVHDSCFLRHATRFMTEICWDPNHEMYEDMTQEQKKKLTDVHLLGTYICKTSSKNVKDYLKFYGTILEHFTDS